MFYQIDVQYLDAGTVVLFGVAALLLLLSGFISAAEVAFFSLTPEDKNRLHQDNKPHDRTALYLLENPDHLRNSILIADTFVNLTIVTIGLYAINQWLDFSKVPLLGITLEALTLVILLLLFGEVMPKIYAQKYHLSIVRKTAPVIRILTGLCRPFTFLWVSTVSAFGKWLSRKKHDLSVDELSKALELTSKEIPEEKAMLAEIIKFHNKNADDIMTSRLDMEDIDIEANFHEVIDKIIQCGYSRIPVYKETEDNIKGILYIKDLLPYLEKPDTFRWQSLIRPAYFVPETKKIDDLLEEFRTSKIHMAIVVDEFGGTSGLVTMEDILEEIVGDISDEYDEDEKSFIRLSDGSYIFEAKTPLTDFFRITGTQPAGFEEQTEEVETLGGFLLEIKGDFPRRRETIEYKDCRFQVLEIDNRRILKVKFNRIPPDAPHEKQQ